MKKLMTLGLLVLFAIACTKPGLNTIEFQKYGTDKDKAVNSKGSSADEELEDELDITED